MTGTTLQSERPLLLLIEDDLTLTRLYEEKFSLEGFDVLVAGDAENGKELALKMPIKALLLDVGLPRSSGLDLLAELRKLEKTADLPVIVLTNNVDKKDKDRAMKLGAKEYLVKAMQTPEQVVEKVRQALK